MQILRNVFKRKLRVILTISGITIGVFALVMMGSMAERINLMVSGGTRYYADKVTVSDASAGMFSIQPVPYAQARRDQGRARSGRGAGRDSHPARERDDACPSACRP